MNSRSLLVRSVLLIMCAYSEASAQATRQPPGPPIPIDLNSGYLTGDCDCNSVVNFTDITTVLANLGAGPKATVLQGDANRDRSVTFSDITTILANFGRALPPIQPVQNTGLQVSWDGNQGVRVFDPSTGATVMSWSGCPSWEPYLEGSEEFPELRPSLQLIPKPDGYDLIVKYDNTPANPDYTGLPRTFGVLNVPGIRFGEDVTAHDMRYGGRPFNIHVNYTPPSWCTGCGQCNLPPGETCPPCDQTYTPVGYEWPGDYYSPVAVLSDGEYTVAASIQYPVLDYKHNVYIKYESFCWQHTIGGQNWRLNFQINNRRSPTYAGYNPAANLQPGDQRAYTISVRIARNEPLLAQDGDGYWLRLLQPYRRYHRCLYGPVRYERDPRPVAGYQLAYANKIIDDTNPRGYDPESLRPDVHGWGPHTAQLDFIYSLGWNRVMLWSLSGLYNRRNPNRPNEFLHNYPFQYYTGVQSAPDFSGQNLIRTELDMLSIVGEPVNRELGLWWGHAADFATEWNPETLTNIDPDDPAHMALVAAEVRGVIDLNAQMLGLDALASMWQWQSYWYVQDLQAMAPGRRMIEESRHTDMLHTLAPMYDVALQNIFGNYHQFPAAHFLADFLNPGHEFWGQCDQSRIKTGLLNNTREPTIAEIQQVLSEVAARGITVLNFTSATNHPPVPGMTAAPSWTTSVPPDLRP